jgi:transcriptional regulator GlxA family with amidase domain
MGTTDKVRGKSDKITEIGLLLYPGAQAAAVAGLTDLFLVANRLSAERGGPRARELRTSHWRASEEAAQIARVFDTHDRMPKNQPLVALILPPSLDTEPCGKSFRSHARWMAARHNEGTILCSICAGAFLLAETGLLNGRSATTHWLHAERLGRLFPEIHVNADKLMIDDGDVITAGGLMAWIDLGLHLIHRWIGPTVMLATAHYFLVDAAGREQRFYSLFAPRLEHGDSAALEAQHWVQLHYAERITVDAMALRAKLGERTFLRRFRNATGLKPNEYLQHVRIAKAREALEFSMQSVDEIAWMVGYGDHGAFRKVFNRIVGLSPGEYRKRFGISAGSRADFPSRLEGSRSALNT